MRKLATMLIAAILLSTTFTQRSAAQENTDESARYRLSPAQAKLIMEGRAREIMRALKNRDMRKLSTFVHPRRGVLFSPYVYVDRKMSRVLSRQQLISLYRSNRRLVWGEEDGSGDPIRMTFRRYFNAFVYQQDLLRGRVSYNVEKPQGGNTVSNLWEHYPRAIIVGYHHDGVTGPEGGAMDWQSLYLVFEKVGNNWYLVAVANDEWTI